MVFETKDEAQPLQQLIAEPDGHLVGWLYQWKSGKLGEMWLCGRPDTPFLLGKLVSDLHETARVSYWDYLQKHYKVRLQTRACTDEKNEEAA